MANSQNAAERMFGHPSVRRLTFIGLFAIASVVGRMAILPGTEVNLVWPAAGMAAAWLSFGSRGRQLALDLFFFAALSMATDLGTGASLPMALWFLLSNLAQTQAFLIAIKHLSPHLRVSGGNDELIHTGDLWRVYLAAGIAGVVGGAIGPIGLKMFEHVPLNFLGVSVWAVRNASSIALVICGAHILIDYSHRKRIGRKAKNANLQSYALFGFGAAVYAYCFIVGPHLPIAFVAMGATFWLADYSTRTVTFFHCLFVSACVTLGTYLDRGPFNLTYNYETRALLVGAFISTAVLIALNRSFGRDERDQLLKQLSFSVDQSEEQKILQAKIITSLQEGLVLVGSDGRIIMRNQASRRLLGLATNNTHVKDAAQYGLFTPDGTPIKNEEMGTTRILSGHNEPILEDLLIRNDEVPQGRILQSRSAPISINGERCVITIFHDVTLARRQRDEMSAFAGVVAHDLKNPLSTVLGFSEVLEDSLDDMDLGSGEKFFRDGLGRIHRSAKRMRNLIDDLLALTQAEEGEMRLTDVDLDALAAEVVVGFDDSAKLAKLGVEQPVITLGELGTVQGDERMLRQVIENLVGNAIKYVAEGIQPQVIIQAVPQRDGLIRIDVSDNGIGLPELARTSVFEPFHRDASAASYAGTGLGLAICKRIVERHGGVISVDESPTGGCKFSFTLLTASTSAPSLEEIEASPDH